MYVYFKIISMPVFKLKKRLLFRNILKFFQTLSLSGKSCVIWYAKRSTLTVLISLCGLISNWIYTGHTSKRVKLLRLVMIRGLPFIFRDLATIVLQSANWQLYRKAWHFWVYTYSERFDIWALFESNLKDISRSKNGMKSWIFSCDYFLQLSTCINSTTEHRWT